MNRQRKFLVSVKHRFAGFLIFYGQQPGFFQNVLNIIQ
ncbi:MAG: hypothetical protein DKINENOH_00275 [bacterium]|nr:hypothetical protein [bacterium]